MGNTQERRKSRRSSKQSTAQRSRDRLGTATSSLAETVQRSGHQHAPASGERSFRSDPDDILPGLDYSPEGIADQLRDMRIQRALDGTDTTRGEVPDTVLDVLGSGGQPLDGTIQRTLEDRMDADFSNVRIHTGAKAAEAADAIDAKAFTCGNDIVFNAGEYDPNSAEGQFLLAHELAHVKQQTGAAISMMPQKGADLEIDPDPQLEREADQAAEQALSADEPLIVSRMGTDVHIQRTATDDSGFASPSQIRKLVSEEIEQRVPEEVDKRLEQRSKELEEMLSGSGELDEEALEDLGVDLDAIDTGEGSWWERLRDGATDNRTAVTAGVGATFAALTTVASAGALPLAAGAAVAASGAFASSMLGKGAADAALGEESNLSPEEFATIVETVKRELQESDETSVGTSQGDELGK